LGRLVSDAVGAVEKKLKQTLELGKDDKLNREFGSVACEPSFLSRAWLDHAIKQLCRADIVFFDITEYQPLVMLLLGIRAAARRGVNILCTYEEINASFWSRLPFNIKEMYPVAVGPTRTDPQAQVGRVLLDALARQKAVPGYSDLPGFELLRRGALADRFRNPVHWEKEILWLCSFDEAYTKQTNASTIRDKIRAVFGDEVGVHRLTEILSSELASGKLFDAIRRYTLCLVDWTQWSSNVFFELGVRLAASPWSPVCLFADSPLPAWARDDDATRGKLARHEAQIAWLERAFGAIRYEIDGDVDFDLSEVKLRIERMQQAEKYGPAGAFPTFGLFRYDFVYGAIAAETSAEQQGLRSPLELLRLAAADVVGEAGQRRLNVVTMYADRNQELNEGSRRIALDYQIAAWLFARAAVSWEPTAASWKEEEQRLALRLRSLLEHWPSDDPRKIQILAELDSVTPDARSGS
jgi:hypothetical protein